MLSALLGMVVAIVFDFPPGPAMVVVATSIYFLTAFFSPSKGILVKFIRTRNQRIKIEQEDILRQAIKQPDFTFTRGMLTDRLSYGTRKISNRLQQMRDDGLLSYTASEVSLTAKGVQAANALVRAHRLWESYQVTSMGLGEGQIHDEADRLEHHLTEEILDMVDVKLGYPDTDPHGSPIPKKELSLKLSLLGQRPAKRVYLKDDQPTEEVESGLWELGLTHDDPLVVKAIGKDEVIVTQRGKSITVPASLARNVEVTKLRTSKKTVTR